jgi:hypothetical protein
MTLLKLASCALPTACCDALTMPLCNPHRRIIEQTSRSKKKAADSICWNRDDAN